jgi:small subunit ribosomal protein S1
MNDELNAGAVAEELPPVSAEPPAAAETTPSADPRPGGERIKIGSEREAPVGETPDYRAKPVTPVGEGTHAPKPSAPIATPSARTPLTPEQEAELAAAMAGQSIDELMADAATAPTELAPETKLRGRVVRIHGDNVFVDLGHLREGVLPLQQFEPKGYVAPAVAEGEAPASPSWVPAEGTEIDIKVVRLSADDAIYELTLPHAVIDIGNWDEVHEGQTVDVLITGHNKGGLECQVAGIRGFMPMGQISLYRVENAEEYVGQKLTAVITEANRAKRNLILSHRALMERERLEKRDKLVSELAPGQVRDGVVRSLRDFGAFVDLGGVDGLIHVSKLSWDRVAHPRDVLAEGQAVKVKIEKIDPTTGKIALSYREQAANPWDKAEQTYPVGGTARGKVSKVMEFGAFVRLEAGVEGLIHISELAHQRVHRTGDVVSEGQDVEAKVLSVDRSKQRIALSLKALQAAPQKAAPAHVEVDHAPEAPRAPRKEFGNLKGGIGGPSGGDKFGLKW